MKALLYESKDYEFESHRAFQFRLAISKSFLLEIFIFYVIIYIESEEIKCLK